jgi:hypothetical protein
MFYDSGFFLFGLCVWFLGLEPRASHMLGM